MDATEQPRFVPSGVSSLDSPTPRTCTWCPCQSHGSRDWDVKICEDESHEHLGTPKLPWTKSRQQKLEGFLGAMHSSTPPSKEEQVYELSCAHARKNMTWKRKTCAINMTSTYTCNTFAYALEYTYIRIRMHMHMHGHVHTHLHVHVHVHIYI